MTSEIDPCPGSEEIFDVVDEFDNVVDALPRSEIHRRGLRHRAVHIFLFRSDRRLLIHLRTDTKEEFPSVWTSSASGHVSSGESYATSAERELLEELGIQSRLKRAMKFAACLDTSNEFTELFVTKSDETVQPDPAEMADVQWLLPVEIDEQLDADPRKFSPAFRLLFTAWRNSHPSIKLR